jgi:hypothetical protein
MLSLVVKGTLVLLGVSMLSAEDILALASEAEKTYLSLAVPAYTFVFLYNCYIS